MSVICDWTLYDVPSSFENTPGFFFVCFVVVVFLLLFFVFLSPSWIISRDGVISNKNRGLKRPPS